MLLVPLRLWELLADVPWEDDAPREDGAFREEVPPLEAVAREEVPLAFPLLLLLSS